MSIERQHEHTPLSLRAAANRHLDAAAACAREEEIKFHKLTAADYLKLAAGMEAAGWPANQNERLLSSAELRPACVQAAFHLLQGARAIEQLAIDRRQQPPAPLMSEMKAVASELLDIDAALPGARVRATELLGRTERLRLSIVLWL